MRHQIAADRFEPLALDRHAQPLHDLVDADLAAEHVAAVPFVDDRLGFDIVLVANLADNLLEQILDRDQPGGAAVLVDDKRALRLLPLELLQELRHALGLGHHDGGAHERRDCPVVFGRAEEDEILDEHEPCDVVEALFVDRKPRVLLLAKERAELADRRAFPDGDDIGPRRHHFAHQRVAEIDDALQEPPLFAFDQALLLRRLDIRLGDHVGLFRGFVGRGWRTRRPLRVGDKPRDRTRHRPERPGDRRERRQQQTEHALGIAIDEQNRQQQLADDEEHGDAHENNCQPVRAPQPDDTRQERRGCGGHETEQHADRDEQQQRIVEIRAERARTVAPFGCQPERQAHQRAERSFDCAEIHARAGEQEDQEREHGIEAPARSMRPSRSPALRSNRRSSRRMRPLSRSWSKPRRCRSPCSARIRSSVSSEWPESRAWRLSHLSVDQRRF